MTRSNSMRTILFSLVAVGVTACTPTIAVKAPDKPLEINLNIKVDHNITVRVDKQLESVIKNNEDIF